MNTRSHLCGLNKCVAGQRGSGILLRTRAARTAALISAVTLLFSITAPPVRADGGSSSGAPITVAYVSGDIYLYQPNGQPPRDVTQTYQTYGYVLDTNGNPIYIQIASDQVHDLKGNVIGFVAP